MLLRCCFIYVPLLLVSELPKIWICNSSRDAIDILNQLQDPLVVPDVEETFRTLSLPPELALGRYVDKSSPLISQLTYSVDRMPHALQQLISFCNVLAYPILSAEQTLHTVVSFSESAVWLIDVLGDMQAVRHRHGRAFPASSLHILQITIRIERALSKKTGVSASTHKKAVTLLILLCGELATSLSASAMLNPNDEETRRTYVMALAIITATSLEDRSIGRLAVSSLVDESSMFYSAMPEGTDIWV